MNLYLEPNIILIDDIKIENKDKIKHINNNNFELNNDFETTNLKSINHIDKKNIKIELNNTNLINLFKTFSKSNKQILDLEKRYNNDIGTLLLYIKPKYINVIDVKYYIPSNLIDLINNFNIFEEKKIISIISYLLLNYSEKIKRIVINELTLLYRVKKKNLFRQVYIIDYIINYLDIVDEFKQNIKYKQLHEIDNKEQEYILNNFNIKFNIKTDICLYINTTNSLIINWIIKNCKKDKLLNSLEKCLNQNKCLIKESDIIRILNLYLNSEGIILNTIWYSTKIPIKLLEHGYLYALKIFKNYYKKKFSNFSNILIKYITNNDKEKLDILIKHEYIFEWIIRDNKIIDLIISSDKYIDYFIKKDFRLSKEYLYKYILKTPNKIQYEKKCYKNIYNNLIKLEIPLNDLIIGNFLNFIPYEKIINFYKKTGDINELIPYIIYKRKYDLLDKLFELNIITLDHYKNNLPFYIKKIFNNRYYTDQKNILNIYKYNQRKYLIISFNQMIKIGLKLKSLNEIKNIVRLYKNIKLNLNYKIVLKQCLNKKFYPFYNKYDSLIKIIEYLKPFIKNYKKIFESTSNINKIINSSNGINFNEIKIIKKYKPEFRLNLELIDCYEYNNSDDFLEIIEYVLEEFSNKNIDDKNKTITMYSKFLKNFVLYFNFSTKYIKNIILLLNKYPDFNNILNQKYLYEILYYYKYTFSFKKILFFEEANIFKFDIYTNTYIICYMNLNNLDLLLYSIKKTPYLKYKTWNYIKTCAKYYNSKIKSKKLYKYSYNFFTKTFIIFSYILNIINEKNIIYPNNPLYNLKPNRPENIDDIKNDLDNFLFNNNFPKTDDNNILDEL